MIRQSIIVSVVLMAASGLSAAIKPDDSANLTFSRSPALHRTYEQVQVGFLRRNAQDATQVLWARHLSRTGNGKPLFKWTDSQSCPALIDAMRRLRDLEMPRPLPLGIGADNTDITLDGVGYVLSGRASYQRRAASFELRSNVETPLARWVDATLSALEPCWKSTEP